MDGDHLNSKANQGGGHHKKNKNKIILIKIIITNREKDQAT